VGWPDSQRSLERGARKILWRPMGLRGGGHRERPSITVDRSARGFAEERSVLRNTETGGKERDEFFLASTGLGTGARHSASAPKFENAVAGILAADERTPEAQSRKTGARVTHSKLGGQWASLCHLVDGLACDRVNRIRQGEGRVSASRVRCGDVASVRVRAAIETSRRLIDGQGTRSPSVSGGSSGIVHAEPDSDWARWLGEPAQPNAATYRKKKVHTRRRHIEVCARCEGVERGHQRLSFLTMVWESRRRRCCLGLFRDVREGRHTVGPVFSGGLGHRLSSFQSGWSEEMPGGTVLRPRATAGAGACLCSRSHSNWWNGGSAGRGGGWGKAPRAGPRHSGILVV